MNPTASRAVATTPAVGAGQANDFRDALARGERIAKRRLPAVADVQRPGRVGRDELHHYALTPSRIAAAVPIAFGENTRNHRLPRERRHTLHPLALWTSYRTVLSRINFLLLALIAAIFAAVLAAVDAMGDDDGRARNRGGPCDRRADDTAAGYPANHFALQQVLNVLQEQGATRVLEVGIDEEEVRHLRVGGDDERQAGQQHQYKWQKVQRVAPHQRTLLFGQARMQPVALTFDQAIMEVSHRTYRPYDFC